MRHRDTVVQNVIVKFCTSGKSPAHMRHKNTVVKNITCVCSGICFSTLRTSVVQNVIRNFGDALPVLLRERGCDFNLIATFALDGSAQHMC